MHNNVLGGLKYINDSHVVFLELRVSWGKKVIEEHTMPLWGQSADLQQLIYFLKGVNSQCVNSFLG